MLEVKNSVCRNDTFGSREGLLSSHSVHVKACLVHTQFRWTASSHLVHVNQVLSSRKLSMSLRHHTCCALTFLWTFAHFFACSGTRCNDNDMLSSREQSSTWFTHSVHANWAPGERTQFTWTEHPVNQACSVHTQFKWTEHGSHLVHVN